MVAVLAFQLWPHLYDIPGDQVQRLRNGGQKEFIQTSLAKKFPVTPVFDTPKILIRKVS